MASGAGNQIKTQLQTDRTYIQSAAALHLECVPCTFGQIACKPSSTDLINLKALQYSCSPPPPFALHNIQNLQTWQSYNGDLFEGHQQVGLCY